jgi:hypothetical protein
MSSDENKSSEAENTNEHEPLLNDLSQKVKNEEWKEKFENIFAPLEESKPSPSLFLDIEDRFKKNFSNEAPKLVNILFNVILNEDISALEQLSEQGIPDHVRSYFQDLVRNRRYSIPLKKSYKLLDASNDWRHLRTNIEKGSEEGVKLNTHIIKWSGEDVEVSSSLSDSVVLSNHVIKNLIIHFPENDEVDVTSVKEILANLGELEENVQKLKDNLERRIEKDIEKCRDDIEDQE